MYICSLPMASAYGISTSNVLNSISGVIQKVAIDTLHGRFKKLKTADTDDLLEPDDESQMEEDVPPSSQRVEDKSCNDVSEDLLATMTSLHRHLDLYISR